MLRGRAGACKIRMRPPEVRVGDQRSTRIDEHGRKAPAGERPRNDPRRYELAVCDEQIPRIHRRGTQNRDGSRHVLERIEQRLELDSRATNRAGPIPISPASASVRFFTSATSASAPGRVSPGCTGEGFEQAVRRLAHGGHDDERALGPRALDDFRQSADGGGALDRCSAELLNDHGAAKAF